MGARSSGTTVTVSSCGNFHSHSAGVSTEQERLRALAGGCCSAVITWHPCANGFKQLKVDKRVRAGTSKSDVAYGLL